MSEIASKMMVSSHIHLAKNAGPPIEVRRCMPVFSCDGRKLGVIAAVCLDSQTQEVTAVLLGSLPVEDGYHLVPIHLIDRLSNDGLYLHITAESAASLEPHKTG